MPAREDIDVAPHIDQRVVHLHLQIWPNPLQTYIKDTLMKLCPCSMALYTIPWPHRNTVHKALAHLNAPLNNQIFVLVDKVRC